MKHAKYFVLSVAIILLDQAVKMLVHFNMDYGQSGQIKVFGDWFKLYYTLNPGMAFGITIGSEYGKFILSGFRMIAMTGIAIYLYRLSIRRVPQGLLWCIALILGGAIGNVVDSIFYGVLLGNAPPESPTPWFHGQVIDMFYIDIWEGILHIPVIGDQYYSFWPIFNVADASIFVGVCVILIFQKKFFAEGIPDKKAVTV
jgi:signal peptidase II